MKKKTQVNTKEKKVLKELLDISIKIKKHNKLYHQYDKPIISDDEFDKLTRRNNFLEKKFPQLKLENSPNNTVGGKVSRKFSKIKHKAPMLSLGNAFNDFDLDEFIKRIRKYINDKNIELIFSCEPKIDGLSINLTYENGELALACTRGDGYV